MTIPETVGTTRSARWALASLSLCMLLSSLGTSIANVALPTLGQTFGAPFQDVQWIVLAYLLASTTLVVGAGRLGDVVGRRRLLLIGITIFTAASLLCGVAPTLWVLIAARAAQGLGAAILMALTTAMVGETVSKQRIGSAMGLLGTTSAIGTALGPSLGGALVAGLGWRAIFLVNIPLGLLAAVLAHRTLAVDRRDPTADRASVDTVGTLLLALTLAAYALAMTTGRGSFGPLNLLLLAATGVGVGLFGAFPEAGFQLPLGLAEVAGQFGQLVPAEQHEDDHQDDQQLLRAKEFLHCPRAYSRLGPLRRAELRSAPCQWR